MSDLPKQLRIKAGMISMGERIAWGSDSALMEQAADLIESQQQKIAELEAKTSCYMGVGNGDGRLFVYGDHESIKAAQRHILERDELRQEIEILRMQLTACGVVAMANTPESANKARAMHPEYMSASCQDVMGAVDREMAHRDQMSRQAELIERQKKRYAKLSATVERLRDIWQSGGGCGDHNCCFLKPEGMGTNGGCRCYRNSSKMQILAQKMAMVFRATSRQPTTGAE